MQFYVKKNNEIHRLKKNPFRFRFSPLIFFSRRLIRSLNVLKIIGFYSSLTDTSVNFRKPLFVNGTFPSPSISYSIPFYFRHPVLATPFHCIWDTLYQLLYSTVFGTPCTSYSIPLYLGHPVLATPFHCSWDTLYYLLHSTVFGIPCTSYSIPLYLGYPVYYSYCNVFVTPCTIAPAMYWGHPVLATAMYL